MKKIMTVALSIVLVICFTATLSLAAEKRGKFGVDSRHDIAKRVSFKPSTEKVSWKMIMSWSKGLLFYDMAVHF